MGAVLERLDAVTLAGSQLAPGATHEFSHYLAR
jgi:hypothetical protein